MSEAFSRRLIRAIGQLALALLNATLILIVAVLLLAWNLASKVESVTETAISSATRQIAELSPLAEQVASLQDELSELRTDIAGLKLTEDTKVAQAADTILVKLDDLDAELSEMNAALAPVVKAISTDPGIVVDRAVKTGLAEVGAWVTTLSGCNAPAGDT